MAILLLTRFYLSQMSHLKITLDITNLFRRQEWVTKSIAAVPGNLQLFSFFKPTKSLQECKTAYVIRHRHRRLCVYHVSTQTICLSAIARPTAADPYLIVIMIMMMMIMMKMKIIRRTLIMVQFTKVSTIVNYHRSCVLYFCLLSECNCSNWSISLCFDVADYDDNHHVTMIVSSSSISKVLGVFFFGYWGRGPSTKVVQCPGCNLRLHDDLFISICMSIQSSTI